MIKPLGERVLVKIQKEDEKTKSGIIIGNGVKDKIQYAKVCKIGENIQNKKEIKNMIEEIKIDDVVIIDINLGVEISNEKEEYIIIKKEDIYGIVI